MPTQELLLERSDGEIERLVDHQRASEHIRLSNARRCHWLNRVEFAELVRRLAPTDVALGWSWLDGMRLYDALTCDWQVLRATDVVWSEPCDDEASCQLRPGLDWARRLELDPAQHRFLQVRAFLGVKAGPGLLGKVQREVLALRTC